MGDCPKVEFTCAINLMLFLECSSLILSFRKCAAQSMQLVNPSLYFRNIVRYGCRVGLLNHDELTVFPSGRQRAGIVGGVTVAAGFSFLNIGVATLAAFLVKNVRHRSIFRKLIGIIAFPLYLAFAAMLNLALGHYRETSQVLFGGAGQEVIRRLTESPFLLDDIQSWVLTGIGIAFSIGAFIDASTGAFIDASTIGDPYLGYS